MAAGLYLDNDSGSAALVEALRRAGVDAVRTTDVGNRRASDQQQLEFACERNLAVYTANTRDWVALHREWMESGRTHPGVIVRSRQRWEVGAELRALLRVFEAFPGARMDNLLLYLENWAR